MALEHDIEYWKAHPVEWIEKLLDCDFNKAPLMGYMLNYMCRLDFSKRRKICPGTNINVLNVKQ